MFYNKSYYMQVLFEAIYKQNLNYNVEEMHKGHVKSSMLNIHWEKLENTIIKIKPLFLMIKKNLKHYGPFLWIWFNCLNSRATSGRQFTFTIKFPEIPNAHFINLGRMKGWVDLGATWWFWTWAPWIGNCLIALLDYCRLGKIKKKLILKN